MHYDLPGQLSFLELIKSDTWQEELERRNNTRVAEKTETVPAQWISDPVTQKPGFYGFSCVRDREQCRSRLSAESRAHQTSYGLFCHKYRVPYSGFCPISSFI